MKRFSIVIPNYNKGKYVGECLESIFNQTIDKEKYEVIVVDDGSSDNSIEEISKYDVRLFKSNRELAGGARNIGIDNATGEYVVFIDSDDFLTSNTVLEKLDNLITDEDMIYLNFTRQTENGDVEIINEREPISTKVEFTKLLGCPSKCFKRTLLDGIRFLPNCYYEDVSFTLEALCNVKKDNYFDESFFTYRAVPGSITKTKEISSKKMVDVFMQIARLYYFCDKYPQYKLELVRRIKRDKLETRIEVLNEYFETGKNTFYEKM